MSYHSHNPTLLHPEILPDKDALTVLLQAGIHPLIAIATVGLWGDAEKTFNLSKPYLENLYKTIDDAEAQKAKAQEIVDQMNKKDKAITE